MKSFTLLSRIVPLTLLVSLPLAAAVTEVKSKDELHSAVKGAKKIAIKVHADWCGACKISAKPFSNAAAKHSDVKALSLDADNREFRKFVRTFQVEGLPTTVYIRKVEPTDSDYEDIAKLVGVEGKATIVLTKKEVGSRNEEEFTKSLAALGAPAPSAKTTEKPAVTVEPEPAAKPVQAKTKKRGWRSRRKVRHDQEVEDMRALGFPMSADIE